MGKARDALFAPVFNNNPVALQVLGICSALAVTTKLETAATMCLAVTFVLMFSNLAIAAIRNHIPTFDCAYRPDFRQEIADTWPRTIDASAARIEWGWQPQYDLGAMTSDMLSKLAKKQREGSLPGRERKSGRGSAPDPRSPDPGASAQSAEPAAQSGSGALISER